MAMLSVLLLLSACGGGGGGSGGSAAANVAPVANAGPAQTVGIGAAVQLNGAASSDADGSIAGYAWTQIAGIAVTLQNASAVQPSFTAPVVSSASVLTFQLIVTDNLGTASAPETVLITVSPGTILGGTVRFGRVQLFAGPPFGLNYSNVVQQPARGVTVQVLDANTQAILASGVTSGSGAYSLAVPVNANVVLQVVAQMVRDASQPLPRWNVRVQDGTTGNTPYTYTGAAFNSSVGVQNIDIPTGIATNGTATGQRGSGPFAILDTIYTAMQYLVGVVPNINFPDLYVDWGSQKDGTFFTTGSGQHIALMADLTEDTDEFDQHVIAHEFGHYIEENFSRADNIGGSHALGEKLDMRVAFGEGFGYAFAAIVLNDPNSRDTFVSNGQQVAGGFNIETNPAGSSGCWCSETSVWSILWDLQDAAPDGVDGVTLPFAAIWEVLTNAQRATPATTSIFSFVAALKAAQPASATAIDALVAAQNINSAGANAFATNEINAPFAGLLPLYPTITPGGGPVQVRSIDDGGRHNKAGNHAFLRFTPTSTGAVTVSLTTSNTATNRDPDFAVYRSGVRVALGNESSTEYPEVETFNVTAGQTYIIDVYDCANGCAPPGNGNPLEGTPGDFDLTVTIN